MLATRHFRWLPNAFTISRAVLAVPVFLAAANDAWVLGFWLLVAALLTDFFDGLAAKKLQAHSRLGAELDAIADSLLVAAGFAGLTAAGLVPFGTTIVILAAGAAIGSERWFLRSHTQTGRAVRKLLAVGCLFVAWVFIAWMYAAQAYGWSWLYVLVTLIVLATLARFKRHRIKAWIRGF